MKNIYKETMRNIYAKTAELFFLKNNLSPNFDIIELSNKLGIEVIPVTKLPNNWEYAFNTDDGNLKIYYCQPLLTFSEEELEKHHCSVNYFQKDARFIIAMALADLMAFYRFDDTNIIKGELNGINYFQGKTNGNHQNYALREWEINEFAASLLMPPRLIEEKFYELYQKNNAHHISFNDLDTLSELFGVNTRAIHTRCKSLKLIY